MADDVKESSNVKMVFVTQSPVLTNEVKQYYASLKEQLAAHLLVVERAREAKKEDADPNAPASQEIKPADTTTELEEKEVERQKLLKFLEIREQEII